MAETALLHHKHVAGQRCPDCGLIISEVKPAHEIDPIVAEEAGIQTVDKKR